MRLAFLARRGCFYCRIECQDTRVRRTIPDEESEGYAYSDWSTLAGYFDGDRTVEFSGRFYTLHIRLAFDENWKPHLDGVKKFLELGRIKTGLVRKKESYNTWHVVVSNTPGVLEMAKNLVRFCTKKREELEAVLDYFSDRITGDEFVSVINELVKKGERTRKMREGGPPFTHEEGRELPALAATSSLNET